PLREERITPARPGWWRILANTWTELDRDHVSIMAAGIAFYALLSIFPGMSALISIYGLAADPAVIERQLNAVSGILPQEALLPLPESWREPISMIRWPILAGLVLLALGLVYRFAPARRAPCWHWLSPGTVGATLLWLIASAGFSFYVARFSSYDKTYGSLGAVVILLMWFYLTAYIVLAGAELNAEIEKARAQR